MQPPIVPGRGDQPQTLASVMPAPLVKSRVHPLSIVLAAVGGIALLCGGVLTIGAAVAKGGSAAASPSPVPVYITVTGPVGANSAPAVPSTTTQPAPPAAPTIRDGRWTVGVDIPPGKYRTTAEVAPDCYWEITKTGTNGSSVGDIIANDIPGGGRPSVTLQVGQDFQSSRCGTWALVS
jgi:hypothetical protein